jgi:histidinol-phosphate aminotransferase
LNAAIRQKTFDWLASQGYSYVPSQSNCFMLDAKRPAKEVIEALAKRNVYIGRPWPVWPTHVRITVGTQPEMDAFHEAFQAVVKNSTTTGYATSPSLKTRRSYPDGQNWPSVSS